MNKLFSYFLVFLVFWFDSQVLSVVKQALTDLTGKVFLFERNSEKPKDFSELSEKEKAKIDKDTPVIIVPFSCSFIQENKSFLHWKKIPKIKIKS